MAVANIVANAVLVVKAVAVNLRVPVSVETNVLVPFDVAVAFVVNKSEIVIVVVLNAVAVTDVTVRVWIVVVAANCVTKYELVIDAVSVPYVVFVLVDVNVWRVVGIPVPYVVLYVDDVMADVPTIVPEP